MKYELVIGEIYNAETLQPMPKQVLIITDEQRTALEMFANTEKDEDLNTIYTINRCKFKIRPHFKINDPSQR